MHLYSPHAIKAGKCTAQNGSILTMAAIVLSTAVILLASIDIGFLFYQKRELQKIADMAAIAGAQQLVKSIKIGSDCNAEAIQVATQNARISHASSASLGITTGKWLPPATSVTSVPCGDANAVQVEAERTFGSFFGMWTGQRVHARAIATNSPSDPFAVFSVGSRLLRIENGVVPNLLSALGLNISSINISSYEGIANAKVNTAGLLKALGFQIPLDADVGTLHSLLETNAPGCSQNSCSLGALLQALSGSVGSQQDLVNLLGIQTNQLNTQIKLLSDQNGRGLLTFLETATSQSALKADITAGELITTALQIANSEKGISLPRLETDLGIAGVTAKLGIVEAPSIGIGGVGTTAYTSQVRLYTNITANAPLLVNASIPAVIDLVNGTGEITSLCEASERTPDGRDTATIRVNAPVLGTCVGKVEAASIFSRSTSCASSLGNHEILSILDSLKIQANFNVAALPNESSVTLIKGETKTTTRNDLALGTTLTNLYKAVLAEILGKLLIQKQGDITSQNLVSNLISTTGNTVGAATSFVDNSLKNLQSFIGSLSNTNGSLSSVVLNLLTGITGLVGGLLNAVLDLVGNLLGNLGCGLAGLGGQAAYEACKLNQERIGLENQLNGNQSSGGQSISKVLITLLGLVVDLLEPILNQLGNRLAQLLDDLLGLKLGEIDVTLIDLQCGGQSNVRLVH